MARALDREVTLGELIERFGGSLPAGTRELRVRRLASLAVADAGDLTFLSAARHRAAAAATRATAAIVGAELVDALPSGTTPIVVSDPYAHFATIARWFAEHLEPRQARGVHPSAHIDPTAVVDPEASVGAGAVVEAGGRIGPGATIGPHCHIGRGSLIGAGTKLHAGVVVYHDCRIGDRCIVHSGTVIGSDGFGFANERGRWAKIPQLGGVLIGDDVEIGSNCSIDRGALEDTVIGDGCKLDNLIQIGHNVRVGRNTAMAGCAGVAGSANIGAGCTIGGGAVVLGHLTLADGVHVSAASVVTRSILKPGHYTGMFPIDDNASWEKNAATLKQLHAMRERVRVLENKIKETNQS